jgi:hypothetical protein
MSRYNDGSTLWDEFCTLVLVVLFLGVIALFMSIWWLWMIPAGFFIVLALWVKWVKLPRETAALKEQLTRRRK